jgi:FRG domain
MDTIGIQQLRSFKGGSKIATKVDCTDIRKDPGLRVANYLELARLMAELQFLNRDHVLLFRGQSADYRNLQRNTTLKPSLFRGTGKANPGQAELQRRFEMLDLAERLLVQEYGGASLLGRERVVRQRIVRWSILQHYEVCGTPLLDVTHSLRIAASFASHGANDEAYIFVVGVPSLGGGISASAEAGLQTVRLSSVCPPDALRPHLQEGYLLGEYPDIAAIDQKQLYRHYEVDFGRRLVAKFRFDPKTFWKSTAFPLVGKTALYPAPKNDPLHAIAKRIKAALPAA